MAGNRNDKTEALKVHNKPVNSLVPDTPGTFRSAMQAGENALRQGDYGQAIRKFRQATMLEGKSADAQLALALANMTSPGSYSVAAIHLANAIDIYPDTIRARVNLQGIYGPDRSEDRQDHIRNLAMRTRRMPGDADARLLYGYISYLSGQWQQALDHFQAVERLRAALMDEQAQSRDVRIRAANLLAKATEAQLNASIEE